MKVTSGQGDGTVSSDLDRKILEFFRARDGEVVSGEELSGILGVSRTSVWKHIRNLRELGFAIRSVPAQGYQMLSAPDLLLPAEISAGLTTRLVGRGRIVVFRNTDSTNEVACKLAEDGEPEGTVVLADAQRRGKGRLGRRWESPPSVNIYCSIILRPTIPPYQASQLTFLSAVAVVRAIMATTRLVPTIKWPNDILINGKKVAGLLNEMSAETDTIRHVVLGIGININMEQSQFPADLRQPATSLAIEEGRPVGRTAVCRALLESLDELYEIYRTEGYQLIRDLWLQHTGMIGMSVQVSFLDREIVGIVTGIDDEGALLVRTTGGNLERVLAGDVTFR